MCGLVGFWVSSGGAADQNEKLRRMALALAHRGPDDEGIWMDAGIGIGLAHRRLSILDISPAGHQPMVSLIGHFGMSSP